MRINKLTIRGEKQTATTPSSMEDVMELKESYLIAGAERGIAASYTVQLKDNHLIELVFEDQTTWLCSPDTLEEIFPEAAAANRSVSDAFEIPAMLQSSGTQRGMVSNIFLKVVNVFVKKSIGKEVKKLAAELEKKQLEDYSGLYTLDSSFRLHPFSKVESAKPYLLFLHGTSSSTNGSFGGLMNTEVWSHIQQTYGDNVLAFQHESLTKSPLQNALELVQQLPQRTTLHIISHSRGGLIGDIIARFSNNDPNTFGFNTTEIKCLRDADRGDDVDLLGQLKKELQNKKITVGKFIRVACPAGGTVLASKRLDHLLNIVFNLVGYGTGIAVNPVYIAFKNLIAAAVDSKNDTDILPGLEAMNPDSPFIKVLNSPATEIDNPLTIISGNCGIKLNLKALLIIASKLFYFQDNDLVVNTSSMYRGTRRTGIVQYFFDENAEVDHFHYFKNKSTNEAILRTLKSENEQLLPGFSLIKEESLATVQRNALLNLEGGEEFTNLVSGTKPIVVLLPGIMGSNLTKNGKLVWVNYARFLTGEVTMININANGVSAPSLIKTSYKKLVDYLMPEYDVVTFPFDWRLHLNKSADFFNDKMEELLKYKQPIKIIGHSMGGVLVRDFIIRHPDTWNKLNSSEKFRLLFLGAPLGGSFRIPAVLFGQDALIDKLAKIDLFHSKKDLLEIFSKMPGVLSLLPHTKDNGNDFAKMETWDHMKSAYGKWPTPLKGDLNEFAGYREKILNSFGDVDLSNATYIAGKDKATPCGFRVDDTSRGKELVFLSTAEGDQSVTWESGIPKKMIDANAVYYVNVTHGMLPNEPSIFKGIAEILENGKTESLSRVRPAVRGAEKLFRAPVQESFDISPEGIEKTILGLEPQEKTAQGATTKIKVSVSNGDLHYASYPVLAGHFLGDGILSAESAINYYLDGVLSERNSLGIYPGEISTSDIFISGKPDFRGAIVVGLGLPGTLTAYRLARTVEQGVIRYLLALNPKRSGEHVSSGPMGSEGLSSLVVGGGYGGLSAENSLRAIIQGVQRANEKIRNSHEGNPVLIQQLEFIELYEDTALKSFYSLKRILNEQDRSLNIMLGDTRIKTLPGSKKQLSVSEPSYWWKRLNVTRIKRRKNPDAIRCLQFSLSTGGAREEQRDLFSSTPILEGLIEDISTSNRWSPSLAKTIFELLIPNDFKEQLRSQSNISWVLEKDTAGYPWELLQDAVADAKPLCVSAGMIRQLITQDYRTRINAVTKDNALVVGDPDLDGFVNQLPGAFEEGHIVGGLLSSQGFATTNSLNESASQIIEKLFREDYKIIHLAGHGVFNKESPEKSGMLIGKDVYLSTREICQISGVPELVFVNCCYLGRMDGHAEELFRSRYKLAANIGTQLIENGVKAVVVAGWAVNDAEALAFTKTFYQCMFDGDNFGNAVLKARRKVYEDYSQTNTWGAYQCYGDPFYKFREGKATRPDDQEFVVEEQAEIELHNLANGLASGQYKQGEYATRLSAISNAVDRAGLRNAVITQKEALIYLQMGDYDPALAKFESLLSVEDASFSIATLEKYCNARAKKYTVDFTTTKKNPARYLSKMDKVIEDLQTLIKIGKTAERYSLLGSTWKRKTIMYTTKSQKVSALTKSAYFYQKANDMDRDHPSPYSVTNWLVIESILISIDHRKWDQEVKVGREKYLLPSLEKVKDQLKQFSLQLENSSAQQTKYWDMVGLANVKLCLAVLMGAAQGSKKAWEDVFKQYRETWAKAGSKGQRMAEIEHLDFLISGFSLSTKKTVGSLRKSIEQLRDELSKMI